MSDLHQNFIAGEWITGAGVARNIDPSNTNDVVGEYAQADADVLCVQHEFGIFGGQAGNYLLATLNEATCHAKNRVHGGPQDDHISAYTVLLSQALQAQSVSFPLSPQKIRLDRIPPDVHTFVAGQLGLLWDHSKLYAWNSRTREVNKLLALQQPTHLG